MKHRPRKGYWKLTGCIVLLVFAVLAGVAAWYETDRRKECQKELWNVSQQLEDYQHSVYVAAKMLPKGTILTEENTQRVIRTLEQNEDCFLSEEDLGKAVICDIPEGVCLLKLMVTEKEQQYREVFLAEVELPGHLLTGDRIDVRIRYANAEDYVILSDKLLLSCEQGAGMVLPMTEEEILLFSSALADYGEYEHTRLYAVKYPEFHQTEESGVNYPAALEILKMLEAPAAEEKERKELEKRLEENRYD
ncbi:MAG: hypothetical protein J6J42_14055 [Lachnospiraceae bacterium]|nr:hypothetical protein [Lachnospiraceae bacterium]